MLIVTRLRPSACANATWSCPKKYPVHDSSHARMQAIPDEDDAADSEALALAPALPGMASEERPWHRAPQT